MGGFTELMTRVKLSADLLNTVKAQSLPVLHQTESRGGGGKQAVFKFVYGRRCEPGVHKGPGLCAENLICVGPRTRRPLATQALSTKLISEDVDRSWRFGGGRDRQVLIYLGLQALLLEHRKC